MPVFLLLDRHYEVSQTELNRAPQSVLAEAAACSQDDRPIAVTGWRNPSFWAFEVHSQFAMAVHALLWTTQPTLLHLVHQSLHQSWREPAACRPPVRAARKPACSRCWALWSADSWVCLQLALGCLQQPRPEGLQCKSSAEAIEALSWLNIPRALWPKGLHLLQKQADACAVADAQARADCDKTAGRLLKGVLANMDTLEFSGSSDDPYHLKTRVSQAARYSVVGSGDKVCLQGLQAAQLIGPWTENSRARLTPGQLSALRRAAASEHLDIHWTIDGTELSFSVLG